jgi:Mpv17/PMP22 family protein
MTIAEGGGRRAITRKFQDVYVPALKANYMIWPAVQLLNFRVMPIQFQIVCIQVDVLHKNTDPLRSHLSRLSVLLGRHT